MILKNGKRIDGCTDTLPVGTVQPFLGLTPPLGYLVCQGQLISKVEYPELYKICGSTFGAETDTHFYLPDLRGKTIAGYDSNDDAMNTIGKLLGNKTHTHTSAAHTHTIAGHTHTSAAHTHTTGNHTLTVAEIPGHRHSIDTYIGMVTSTDAFALNDSSFDGLVGSDVMADGVNSTPAPSSRTSTIIGITGGSGAHNHGNTGSTTPGNTGSTSLTSDSTTPGATGSNTNFQPTITMNWIVKAVMLIPEYFVVENTLTSTSTSNALSAAQGKILNSKMDTLSDKVDWLIPFHNNRDTWYWGSLTPTNGYTQLIEWMDDTGGSMAYAVQDAKLSVQIDGAFYQGEGRNRVLDTSDQTANYGFYKWPSMISLTASNPIVSKEITITTKRGNPVLLMISGDNNPQATDAKNWFGIFFYRNGTKLCQQICESNQLSQNIPFCMQYLDVVGPGTYTYKVEFSRGNGHCDLGEDGPLQTPNFTVMEL